MDYTIYYTKKMQRKVLCKLKDNTMFAQNQIPQNHSVPYKDNITNQKQPLKSKSIQ